MDFNDLLIEKENQIALVTINRPKVLNALNAELIRQLSLAFGNLEKENDVQVIILTGSGEKAFVAGADIKELSELNAQSALAFAQRGLALMQQIEEHRLPVIAAINGFALGGGCEIALACDIRIAIETAKIGLPEVSLGLIPGFGGTQRLARLVGRGRAKQMMFSGEHINAAKALELGLIDTLVPADWKEVPQDDGTLKSKPDGTANKEKLIGAAKTMAEAIIQQGSIAVQAAKRAVNHGLDMSLSDGCAYEAALFSGLFATKDAKEGMSAFLEKRKAKFSGE